MLFNNEFDLEPASGAKPAKAVAGLEAFLLSWCVLKWVVGGSHGRQEKC